MNLLPPHHSWEVEGWTAVFTDRTLWGSGEPLSSGRLCDSPLPNPEMSFHMWTEELDICKWNWNLEGGRGS
ncbi:hypothetical protein EYF80_034544 [Liparis tanakae]|uniref:Uncharacterized protein n=1 Tax=Liparis tanakae TaxID=230148 RepID=A0A4Z2GNQ3_9TELE|nr:hypothetical protein EYF80_034544 [Liparis tanakae]